MSIKNIVFGTAASLLLVSGFATTASANESYDDPIQEILEEESDKGIQLPIDMQVGDVYEETVSVNGEEVHYTVSKDDEQIDDNFAEGISIMSDLPQTVPVSGRASFTVTGEFGLNEMSFRVETYQGLIDSVSRPQYNFTAAVVGDDLTIENSRLASYRVQTQMSIPWIGGPSGTQTVEARITSPGANQNINYLETEVF